MTSLAVCTHHYDSHGCLRSAAVSAPRPGETIGGLRVEPVEHGLARLLAGDSSLGVFVSAESAERTRAFLAGGAA